MNTWTYVAGWVLVHFVWQGLAIAIAAACALRLCRHHSASVRYAIACGAMTAMLLAAVITGALVHEPPVSAETAGVPSRPTAKGTIDRSEERRAGKKWRARRARWP